MFGKQDVPTLAQWDSFLNGHGEFFLTAAIHSLVTILEWV